MVTPTTHYKRNRETITQQSFMLFKPNSTEFLCRFQTDDET